MAPTNTPLKITDTEIVNDFLLIKWSTGEESILSLQILRDNCPCATCAGETDVFGNIYKGPPQRKSSLSYQLSKIESVGHYALRFHWSDGHNTGIYTHELIQALAKADTKAGEGPDES